MVSFKILFLTNWALNILLVEFFALRKLKSIIKVDEARDRKYQAFRRTDVKWFNRLWLYPLCHLALAKIILAFSSIAVCGILINLCMLGLKKDAPITGIRYKVIRVILWVTSVIVLWCACSCVWVKTTRPKVCWKQYLGPDWKADYDSKHCGSVVANHASFLDSALHGMV